jgi:glucokinase
VVVDDAHVVLGESRHPTPTEGGPQDVADTMVAALRDAAQAAGTEPAALAGVGVGSPGDVDASKGTVSSARNLPGWIGEFALGEALERELGTGTRLGNDVRVATDAEFEPGAGTYRAFVGRQRPQGVTIAFAMNFQDDPSPLIFPVAKTLAATHR